MDPSLGNVSGMNLFVGNISGMDQNERNQINLNKNGYKGKCFKNNIVWTPKLANMTALVNPDNILGLKSFPALGVIPSTGGFPIILIIGGFVCFLKTFTKMLIINESINFNLDSIERKWGLWSLSSFDDRD